MNEMGTAVVLIIIILFVFLILREVVMWYLKINRRIELQEETIKELKEMKDFIMNSDNKTKEVSLEVES